MRNALRLAQIALMAASVAVSLKAQGEKYSGEIFFKGGPRAAYNYFSSELAGDKLPYAEDENDMKDGIHTLDLPMIRIAGVSRIDFLKVSKEEKSVLEKSKCYHVRKATVTFRDGTKKENIFLDVSEVKWTEDDAVHRVRPTGEVHFLSTIDVDRTARFRVIALQRVVIFVVQLELEDYCPLVSYFFRDVETAFPLVFDLYRSR